MEWNLLFFINSVCLGIGLAMDAFSVSLANGLSEPDMGKRKMCGIAGVFALFQALMPMLGWIFVHTLIQYFAMMNQFIPWIAFFLLLLIGGKMLWDGMRKDERETVGKQLEILALLVQGVATSIDALSVGFTIAGYGLIMALTCALIIAAVTFVICIAGLVIGKRFGTVFSGRAAALGGIILIGIGIEIVVSGVL